MPDPVLLLWLEAPMQSWGFDSRFSRRDTLDFPTRSGVLGLLCCAMGAGGGQRVWLEKMSAYSQTVLAYGRKKIDGTVQEKLPRLMDFQMVGSGYDDQDIWQNLLIPKTSDRKKAVGGGTKLTYRYYLQDACFAVLLTVPCDQAEKLANALQNPVWDLYLGRKNCVPTDIIYRGIFAAEEDARQAAGKIAEEKGRIPVFEVLDGACPEKNGEILSLNDVPVQFGPQKQYRVRQVTVVAV